MRVEYSPFKIMLTRLPVSGQIERKIVRLSAQRSIILIVHDPSRLVGRQASRVVEVNFSYTRNWKTNLFPKYSEKKPAGG